MTPANHDDGQSKPISADGGVSPDSFDVAGAKHSDPTEESSLALAMAEVGLFRFDVASNPDNRGNRIDWNSFIWNDNLSSRSDCCGCVDKDWESFSEEVFSEDLAVLRESMTELVDGRTKQADTVIRVRRQGSGIQWQHLRARIHLDGEKLSVRGTATDISAYKRIEKELVDSHERLHLALKASRAGLLGKSYGDDVEDRHPFSAEGDLWTINVNPLYGLSENSSLAGKDILEKIHPEDAQKLMDLIDSWVRLRCEEGSAEFRVIWPDGSTHWLLAQLRYSYDEQGALRQYTGTLIDVTERRQAEEQIYYLATHDSLTGLLNRASFMKVLDQRIAKAKICDESCAVFFLDLDGFKQINDELGHDAGDIVLREVALRLKACLRTQDIVARIGGDEFVVMLDIASGIKGLVFVATKVLQVVAEPLLIEGQHRRVWGSLGIARYPEDTIGASELIRLADLAMLRAKKTGKNRYVFHSSPEC